MGSYLPTLSSKLEILLEFSSLYNVLVPFHLRLLNLISSSPPLVIIAAYPIAATSAAPGSKPGSLAFLRSHTWAGPSPTFSSWLMGFLHHTEVIGSAQMASTQRSPELAILWFKGNTSKQFG